MIDFARASIDHIESRLARIAAERDSLELLRDSWHHYIELHGGLVVATDQPSTDPAEQSEAPSVVSVSGSEDPSAVSMSAAVSSSPGDEPPAPIEQPGSVLSDVGTGRVGTPTPASHPRPIVSCSECDWTGRALGVHRRHRHGHRATKLERKPKPAATKVDPTVQRRQRQAAESSPRAAVVRRVGNQVQCPSCKDLFVDEAKLQRHREISHGLRADGHSESYLCSRCPKTFPTREDRDAHQATHPADPVALTVGRDSAAQRQVGSGVQIA